MSRGRQHHSWTETAKHQALREKIRLTRTFLHFTPSGYSSLTYQSCRFCGAACYDNHDAEHGPCPMPASTGAECRGLWKYAVRHYLCSPCRSRIVLGLRPYPRPEEGDHG